MASILFKWFLLPALAITSFLKDSHPIFVSVVEIEHNQRAQMLEISLKIFTDDFEKALRKTYNAHIDLLDKTQKPAMDKLVSDYIHKHFAISVDGRSVVAKFIGFEQDEEGIMCFLETNNIKSVRILSVQDNVLYEYETQQMSLLHVTVNGITKNFKLNNPESTAKFFF